MTVFSGWSSGGDVHVSFTVVKSNTVEFSVDRSSSVSMIVISVVSGGVVLFSDTSLIVLVSIDEGAEVYVTVEVEVDVMMVVEVMGVVVVNGTVVVVVTLAIVGVVVVMVLMVVVVVCIVVVVFVVAVNMVKFKT